jgi:general stress protein 26
MALDHQSLSPELHDFLVERHLASLTLVRPDGRPHVTAVGFTYDPATTTAFVITWAGANKARLLESGGLPGALCQIDGRRWLSFSGIATVSDKTETVEHAVARYAARYRTPSERPDRVVIELAVNHLMGNV